MKESRGKAVYVTSRATRLKIKVNFLSESIQARREQIEIFKLLIGKENNLECHMQ